MATSHKQTLQLEESSILLVITMCSKNQLGNQFN